jgi:hypothetical protein
VPEFFGDEGGEGGEEEEELAEDEVLDGEDVGAGGGVLDAGFRDFDIPVAKVIPEKGVEALGGGGEFVFGEGAFEDAHGVEEGVEEGVVVVVEARGGEAGEDGGEGGVVGWARSGGGRFIGGRGAGVFLGVVYRA